MSWFVVSPFPIKGNRLHVWNETKRYYCSEIPVNVMQKKTAVASSLQLFDISYKIDLVISLYTQCSIILKIVHCNFSTNNRSKSH